MSENAEPEIVPEVTDVVKKKVDISAGLKKDGDDNKTPVDGVSSKSVNLAMGLQSVQENEKKTPLSIVSISRGLNTVSNDAEDAAPSNEPVDEAAILAALTAAGAVTGSPLKGEAWEKKLNTKKAEHDNIPSADLLSSLGICDVSAEESWENKTHGNGADMSESIDILSKLGLSDDAALSSEAWEVKK